MVGVDTLRRRMLDEAFDKSQFPSFGESQPTRTSSCSANCVVVMQTKRP